MLTKVKYHVCVWAILRIYLFNFQQFNFKHECCIWFNAPCRKSFGTITKFTFLLLLFIVIFAKEKIIKKKKMKKIRKIVFNSTNPGIVNSAFSPSFIVPTPSSQLYFYTRIKTNEIKKRIATKTKPKQKQTQ